ncbi:MAG: spheroidene monooxygenase [Pseudomonadota bacterium]
MERSQAVSLSFFRFSHSGKLWAFVQMGLSRAALATCPGVGFWKLCGSGTGEGFTPLPNTAVYAILATWPDEETARRQTWDAPVYRRYRQHAAESWTVFLSPTSSRGKWSGHEPFAPSEATAHGPVAALTRATIKKKILTKFWGHVPSISEAIGQDPNVAFKIGIGEVPWLHQVTFSIWPDTKSMANFARADGPHARAIRAVREGHWFKEELYARFQILGARGTWEGCSPLQALEPQALAS